MSDRTPLSPTERSIVEKLSHARFPPATASKRFVRDLSEGYVKELSCKGRRFLAFIAHRFRRQYSLTAAEQAWVQEWKDWQPPIPEPLNTMIERNQL